MPTSRELKGDRTPVPGDNANAVARPKVLMVDHGGFDGGSAYESMVADSLAGAFDISRYSLRDNRGRAIRYLGAFLRLGKLGSVLYGSPGFALAVKTFDAALFDDGQARCTIVILHHVHGADLFGKSLRDALYARVENHILKKLLGVDVVVVVSEYWNKRLREVGFRNICKIYNAFKIGEFVFCDEEIESFKRRYGLTDKPIIYLGNYKRGGGVDWAFEALKEMDAHLVASGAPMNSQMPVRCISLEYRDYLRLLKSSTLALAMSQHTEGWSRNAHEAMLCGTPVLGSGKGGMRELLEGGRQLICDDPKALRATVNALVHNEERRIELGRAAYDFASQFTHERFRSQWIDLVGRLC